MKTIVLMILVLLDLFAIEIIESKPNPLVTQSGGQAKPNVIIILTDDQGYGDLSIHGNPVLKTPNHDKLYAESTRFTDYHVAPMCTPTRGELLTGKQAFCNGAVFVCQGKPIIRRHTEYIMTMGKKN